MRDQDDTSPGVAKRLYRVAHQGTRWRQWDGEYVTFSSISGETHKLDIASGEIFRCIINGPISTKQICSNLADFLEVEVDDQLEEAVHGILAHMENAGLIE